MSRIENHWFDWYKLFLKLYPKEYRREYEAEMLLTMQEMFALAESNTEKRTLVVRALKDYGVSLLRQSLWATEESFSEVPGYVKRNTSIAMCLVAPFFVIFAYNITSLYLHQAIALTGLETKTWVIYSIILPIIGLLLVTKTFLSSIYGQVAHGKWREAISTFFNDWLFLGLVVAVLAVVAIF